MPKLAVNPFKSTHQLATLYRIHSLPAPKQDWRLVKEPFTGAIQGLDERGRFRGFAVATNGIIVAIQTGDDRLVFGHIDFFVPDAHEPVRVVKQVIAKPAPRQHHKIDISEFA